MPVREIELSQKYALWRAIAIRRVVSQKLVGGKVNSPNLAFSCSDFYSYSVQAAAFLA
jgi:hypothetical protein